MSLRLAIDCTPLLGNPTGVGAFTRGVIDELITRPEVELVGYGLSARGRRELSQVLDKSVRVPRTPMAAAPLLRSWNRFDWPTIEWWTGKVDVVHGTNFVAPPSRHAASVVTVHDLAAVRYPELCSPTSLRYPSLIQRSIRRGSWVHVPSKFVGEEVAEAFPESHDRIAVVPHGVPPLDELATPAEGRQLAGTDDYVLAIGTIEPRKDLPSLIRAFDLIGEKNPDAHLVVVGVPGWGTQDFDRAVADSLHPSRIIRFGYVSPRQRSALLKGARVFAYPSIYEGFGFPPLEAMAAGVPVVATRAGAVPEVCATAAELIPAGDIEALSDTILHVLDDDGRRKELIERGFERVSQMSWSKCGDGLLELYTKAAGPT